MLLGNFFEQSIADAEQKAELQRRKAMQQPQGLLNIPTFMPQQGATQQQEPDYLGLAQKGLNLWDKAAGTNYGGYAGSAATFGKFVDWAFDKDATGGGLGRRNIHWLEDGFRPVKDTIKEVPGVKPVLKAGGDIVSSVGDFFSKLF